MVARHTREFCAKCGVEFEGFDPAPGNALVEHSAEAHPDPETAEAREEVENFWKSLAKGPA